MRSDPQSQPDRATRQWFIVGRWQEFEGEGRANLLRIVGIGAFYVVELVNYHGLSLGLLELPKVAGISKSFHQAVTALAVAWALVALAVLLLLQRRIFPGLLKYVTTGCDVLFLTGILVVADGPRSPLVIGYFLLLALSTLRFSLPLVRVTTAGTIAGYLVLLGYARWFTVRDIRVPRYHQLIFVLALALTGIVLGQVIRRVRAMAKEYAARVEAARGEPS
jgi:hypothetical protein